MQELINKYLESRRPMWSPATFKSESSRLNKLKRFIISDSPEETFRVLKEAGYKLYTIKTSMTRIAKMLAWSGDLSFSNWLESNSYLFRNAYKSKQVQTTFSEVADKLAKVEDGDTRNTCTFLLKSGIRIHELDKIYEHEGRYFVEGKGGKKRRLFNEPPKTLASKAQIRAELKKIGLTPHDLRRLFATHLMRKNIPVHDVAKATGHSNIQTLMRYLQSDTDDNLQSTIERAFS